MRTGHYQTLPGLAVSILNRLGRELNEPIAIEHRATTTRVVLHDRGESLLEATSGIFWFRGHPLTGEYEKSVTGNARVPAELS
jgi:hypothetical protein